MIPRYIFLTSALALLCLGTGGCATLFKRGSESISVRTVPAGAEVWLDGAYAGRSPVEVEAEVGEAHMIFLRHPGYAEREVRVGTHLGVHWLVLDVLALLWPVIVDAATESWEDMEDVVVTLEPIVAEAGTAPVPVPGSVPAAAPAPGSVPVSVPAPVE